MNALQLASATLGVAFGISTVFATYTILKRFSKSFGSQSRHLDDFYDAKGEPKSARQPVVH
jgi:hypothetical protein